MKIKKGDTVVVITGKDKGKSGKVMEVLPKQNRIVVDNINIVSKHTKPKSAQDKGGIIKKPAPLNASNVMILCDCGKATRVAYKIVDGKKVRVCKKCGNSLDKEHAKAVKKETKKVAKTEKETAKAPAKTVKVETAKTEPAKTVAKKQTVKTDKTTKTTTTATKKKAVKEEK